MQRTRIHQKDARSHGLRGWDAFGSDARGGLYLCRHGRPVARHVADSREGVVEGELFLAWYRSNELVCTEVGWYGMGRRLFLGNTVRGSDGVLWPGLGSGFALAVWVRGHVSPEVSTSGSGVQTQAPTTTNDRRAKSGHGGKDGFRLRGERTWSKNKLHG